MCIAFVECTRRDEGDRLFIRFSEIHISGQECLDLRTVKCYERS